MGYDTRAKAFFGIPLYRKDTLIGRQILQESSENGTVAPPFLGDEYPPVIKPLSGFYQDHPTLELITCGDDHDGDLTVQYLAVQASIQIADLQSIEAEHLNTHLTLEEMRELHRTVSVLAGTRLNPRWYLGVAVE